MTDADILVDVSHERDNQITKWGEQSHRSTYWLTVLGEEFGEVAKSILENTDNLEEELIQCAAVCVAWVHDLRSSR